MYQLALAASSAATYNVESFGARGDGRTDSTKAFLRAWSAACKSAQPATIYVPRGRYLMGKTVFEGKCGSRYVTFRIEGTLVAPSDFRAIGNEDNWILFHKVSGVSIFGGTLDGQGSGLWHCKKSGNSCPEGARSLEFTHSEDIFISGLTSLDSQKFHIVIDGCNKVKLQGVKVSASGDSLNTDGIHVSSSSRVTIMNSKISTGDDCISVGPGTSYLWVENIACGPGHGISIGSLGKKVDEDGVQHVTVKTVTFTGTQNGLRIKTWGKPSKCFVNDVLFQHATMVNVQNPIIIDQNYCPHNQGCTHQASGVRIHDVTYQDIHGSSATEVAIKFDCSKKYPCGGIKLEDVDLSYRSEPAQATCANVGGTTLGVVEPRSCL
ncbi:Polygalacturonase [Bertholletia excelsa]